MKLDMTCLYTHLTFVRYSSISSNFCGGSNTNATWMQRIYVVRSQSSRNLNSACEWLYVHRNTARCLPKHPSWISVANGVGLSDWVYCWWTYFHCCVSVRQQRVCIKFCLQLGKTAAETHQMLKQAFGDNSLGQTQLMIGILRGFSLQANYTDRATTACWRS
jgi:hypothetical protein